MDTGTFRQHRMQPRFVFASLALMVCTLLLALGCTTPSDNVTASTSGRTTSLPVSDTAAPSSSAASSNLSPSTAYPNDESEDTKTASSSSAASHQPDQALAARITQDIQAISDTSGMQTCVSVIDLASGTHADVGGRASMVSASMIKLIIAAAFLEQVEAGAYSLDGYYPLQASDIVGGTGVLGARGAGAQITYGEILNKMISASDNTGTNILIRAIGMDAVNAEAAKLGLANTQLNRYMMDYDAINSGIENYTSADDVATLLELIYNGTFVSPKASSIVLQALEEQQDAGGILGGLPAGVTFAHKTGTLSTVRHDGGIVEGTHPYVLVVLCGGTGFYEQGALSTMSQIASATYSDIVA